MLRVLFIALIGAITWFMQPQMLLIHKGIFFVVCFLLFLFADRYILKKVPFFKLMTALLVITGMLITSGVIFYLFNISIEFHILEKHRETVNMAGLVLVLLIVYLGIFYGGTATYFQKKKSETETKEIYIVDTSSIIDGRIVDVCEAGFLTRSLVIPEFVIREMQLIADSSIHEKRKKGRRGLNILRLMKESDKLSINILSKDYENLRGVDNKLLALAKEVKGKIISNDFNLVKVAEVEGVEVININKIATLLKPPHAVGEKVKVNITKKGNTKRQGVGYLDDDTMVVIDDGEKYINQTKLGIVTAYIQSETGKMLFCKLIN